MKRMEYIIISVAAVAILAVITVGCAVKTPTENDSKVVTGVSLSQNHMNYRYYYSFYIRKDNDKILFDADVRFDEKPYEVILESCEIEKSDFNNILSIIEKYGVEKYVSRYKKKNLPFNAADKTTKTTTLYFSDGSEKSADTGADYDQELYDTFVSLSLKYKGKSVVTMAASEQ